MAITTKGVAVVPVPFLIYRRAGDFIKIDDIFKVLDDFEKEKKDKGDFVEVDDIFKVVQSLAQKSEK
jgi:protein tyrosine phosphatase